MTKGKNMNEIVFCENQEALTTSLLIANKFNKRHSDILRAIKNIQCSAEFSQRNFALAEYIDHQGKLRPVYRITKDGLVFLVMGFTGKDAAKFKEDYINAFNEMYDFDVAKRVYVFYKKHFYMCGYDPFSFTTEILTDDEKISFLHDIV